MKQDQYWWWDKYNILKEVSHRNPPLYERWTGGWLHATVVHRVQTLVRGQDTLAALPLGYWRCGGTGGGGGLFCWGQRKWRKGFGFSKRNKVVSAIFKYCFCFGDHGGAGDLREEVSLVVGMWSWEEIRSFQSIWWLDWVDAWFWFNKVFCFPLLLQTISRTVREAALTLQINSSFLHRWGWIHRFRHNLWCRFRRRCHRWSFGWDWFRFHGHLGVFSLCERWSDRIVLFWVFRAFGDQARSKNSSVLIKDLSICRHEATGPIKTFLTSSHASIEALRHGVRSLRDHILETGRSVDSELTQVWSLVSRQVIPYMNLTWNME